MITGLNIENFKAFGDTQHIPIKPLTFIYGQNSSGKSSILHSLIFARHALETGELDVHRTNLGGDSVDLGGFRQYIHRRDVNRHMEWSVDLDTAFFEGKLATHLAPVKQVQVFLSIGIALDDEGHPLPNAMPEVQSYEISADKKNLLRFSKRKDGKLKLDKLEYDHPVFREVIKAIVEMSTTAKSVQKSDYDGIDKAISEIVPNIITKLEKFLPESLARSENFFGQSTLFPISSGQREKDLASAVSFFIPRAIDDILNGLSQNIKNELLKLNYLGPLRSYPPRHLSFSQHHDPNWFAGGGFAWEILKSKTEVREKINNWLSAKDRLQTPYELVLREFSDLEDILDEVVNIMEIYANYEGDPEIEQKFFKDDSVHLKRVAKNMIEGSVKNKMSDLFLMDKRSNTILSHRDVGIGVSQVLPVLVNAFASTNKLIAIEQPEIHLHPALQTDLADVFIQSALGENKNRFLIETHSEHLLLRVMRRMSETYDKKLPKGIPEIKPEDVAILFVLPKGSSSVILNLEIDKEGQLLDPWPGGFFEEGFRERFGE